MLAGAKIPATKHDTMTHDGSTLQFAIDAAFHSNGTKHGGTLVTSKCHIAWPRESTARLAVAKAFLAALTPAEQLRDQPTLLPDAAQPWTPAVGDVVRLKSGGPEMTVKNITPEGFVSCIWFDPDGQYDQTTMPASCLELVRKEKP